MEKKRGIAITLGDGQDYYFLPYGIGSEYGKATAALLDEYDNLIGQHSEIPGTQKLLDIIEKIVRLALEQQYDNEQIDLLFSKGYVGIDKTAEIINAIQGVRSPKA